MCSSFTWGTVSVHYLLGLPLIESTQEHMELQLHQHFDTQ